tara:strand:- start:323 stop:1363 length:1041 start_codon:yes stop_codon:yes gene_type:complete
MHILIPGGCGFIGSSIAIYLKQNIKNCVVTTIDNLSRNTSYLNEKKLKKHNIKNIKFDLSSDRYSAQADLNRIRVDFIIDCCAEPSVEISKVNPQLVFNSNLKSTLNLLEIAKKKKSKIIYLSTSRVYSIKKINSLFNKIKYKSKLLKKIKINENFSVESPLSIYGFTKLSSEILIKEYSFLYNIKYIINRCGVVSGYGQFGKQDQGFLSMWLWRHLNKLKIYYQGYGGYGHQVRDILDINDLCILIKEQLSKIDKINNQTFNVGGGIKNALSLIELTNYSRSITSNNIKIKKKIKTSKYDLRYFVTDNKKVYSKYKWRVKKGLNLIIKETLKSLIQNKKSLHKIL